MKKDGVFMKKCLILCFVYFLLNQGMVYANNISQTNDVSAQDQLIKNEVCQDLTVQFISPFVHAAINSHYESKKSLTQKLNTSPSLIRIVRIDKVGKINNFEFLLTVEATGFVGDNIPVVDGQITFRVIGPSGGEGEANVFFESFKQLKIYQLPLQWKHIVKKPLE
jgi:Protein of unknown function (DUF3888)